MDEYLSTGSMIPVVGSSYSALDLQGSTPVNPNLHAFPLTMGQIQQNPIASEEDEGSLNEEGGESKGKKIPLWHRVKWTNSMVKLLITAVSYIDEDVGKCLNLQKKGKWRTLSKVMAERGHCVSPQQCEDKFNDLNKRYKKLNDVLGRGTSCQVVENPALLDLMSHLSEKAKEEVRKILNSKQLFYEEMCSYHNSNRLHLPSDLALQRSLKLAIRSRDDSDCDGENDDSGKRMRIGERCMNLEEFEMGVLGQSRNGDGDRKRMESRLAQIEKEKTEIEMEMLEMEKQRFKWERFNRKNDRELEKLKTENERMRLGNEQMALELKRMEMDMANAQ